MPLTIPLTNIHIYTSDTLFTVSVMKLKNRNTSNIIRDNDNTNDIWLKPKTQSLVLIDSLQMICPI